VSGEEAADAMAEGQRELLGRREEEEVVDLR
jgi:hypothetical protein